MYALAIGKPALLDPFNAILFRAQWMLLMLIVASGEFEACDHDLGASCLASLIPADRPQTSSPSDNQS